MAGHLCSCFSDVLLGGADGVALVSFWLVAVETHKHSEIKRIGTRY